MAYDEVYQQNLTITTSGNNHQRDRLYPLKDGKDRDGGGRRSSGGGSRAGSGARVLTLVVATGSTARNAREEERLSRWSRQRSRAQAGAARGAGRGGGRAAEDSALLEGEAGEASRSRGGSGGGHDRGRRGRGDRSRAGASVRHGEGTAHETHDSSTGELHIE